MIRENIGKRIQELRFNIGKMNQQEFSNKIGWDRSYLSKIEKGKQNITIDNIQKICEVLGISIYYFFSDKNLFDCLED